MSDSMATLFEWLQYGGVMLIPIALASLVGVALFVARWSSHRTGRVVPDEVRQQVMEAVAEARWDDAQAACADDPSALARILGEGLRFRGADRQAIGEAMQQVGRREINHLERYVGAIGALASVTPLMGLLGTVLGMIRVFQELVDEVGADGLVDPTALAGGIWEALVTTAAGLAVAIPLYLGYRYLLGRVDSLALDLEEVSGSLLDALAPPPQASPEATDGDTREPG